MQESILLPSVRFYESEFLNNLHAEIVYSA